MTQKDFKALLALELKKQQEALAEFKKLLKDTQYKPTLSDLSAYCKQEYILCWTLPKHIYR